MGILYQHQHRFLTPAGGEDTVEAYRSYVQEEDGDDSTAIAGDGELDDNRVIRLRLEDCAGCTCPKFIEIDLRKVMRRLEEWTRMVSHAQIITLMLRFRLSAAAISESSRAEMNGRSLILDLQTVRS